MRATSSSVERRSFAVGLLALLVAASASATTITVTSTSDAVNGADGACTLREALLAASTNTASGGAVGECAAGQAAPTVDVIAFAIPGGGVHTIAPTAAFAAISGPVTIDGYTQAGASVNTLAAGSNAVLRVVVDASAVGGTTPLLRFAAGSADSQVRGLVVQNFAVPAISVDGVANVKVAGNFVGTSADGTVLAAQGAPFAITLQGASGAVLGGSAAADRNVVAGGSAAQVFVQGGTGAQVLGNLIGTNALGTAALESAPTAIGLWLDAPGVQVGGTLAGAGNLISGNAKGIVIQAANAGAVQGNRIGTDATGTKPLPNAFYGIEIAAPGPGLIGGTAAGEGNVIAFNGGPAVYVNASAGGWRIAGNATFDNGDKGIALAPGPLPLANDAQDADAGANARQNFPLIDSITLSPTSVRVQGRIESGPSRSLVLDVYASRPPVRPVSLLQGEVYLGAAPATITTDAQGKASFDVTLPVTTTPNLWVTATLTDVTGCAVAACGDTSEFAQRSVFAVTPPFGSPTGQSPVSVVGQGFQPGAAFAFGATNANAIAFVDAQTLAGQLPLLNAGTLYDVTVTNPDTSTATMRKAFVTDFVDVPQNSVWYGSVMNLAAAGITGGCLPGQYCGANEVTRAQMALFLTRGRHGPFFAPPPATGIFADVPLGAFAVDWIEQFYGEGITSGCASNPLRYCPDNAVTRAQMAVFLLRSKHGASYVPPPCTGLFADVACTPPAHPFVNWIEQLAREGITAGCAANPARYCPDATVLRLAMAAFIARTFGLDEATNQAPQVSAGANQTVKLPSAASLSGAATDDGLPAPPRTITLTWSKQSGPGTVTFANPAAAWTTASFSAAGSYVLRLTASDGALSAFDETTVTVQAAGAANVPPTANAGPDQVVTLPASVNLSGSASDDGLPNPPGSISVRWSQLTGPGTATFGNFTAAVTTASFSAPGTYVLRLSINDGEVTVVDDLQVTVNPDPSGLPPEPSTVAPPYNRTVISDLFGGTQFLYTGPNPTQTGVAPLAIDPLRVGVVRGKVVDRGGAPVSGVTIRVHRHPELGQTLTRADGRFDLAVNGGGLVTLDYAKAGLLPLQRQADVPWRDFVTLDDAVMIPLDTRVTTITTGAGAMQAHQGSAVTDADGTRTATLMFPAGTTATMTLADGSTQPVPSLGVRTTEYTVGPSGPRAMPAALPPASGYTYAVELSADEAIAAGAKRIDFSQPVIKYVDNFLGFPVGTIVPEGYYDRDLAAWVPSTSGRVIKITNIVGGLAVVDTVGAGGQPAIALPQAELQQLAALYPVGKELWRVPIPHFSTWDSNWGVSPPDDAVSPNQPPPLADTTVDDEVCEATGSIIECQNQILGQSIPIVGTPYTLNYRSIHAPGRVAANTVRIPLSGPSVPPSLLQIRLTISIAGRNILQFFPPSPNQTATFVWDGLDAYGRKVQGQQPVTFDIGYDYRPVYTQTSVFGYRGNGEVITGTGARDNLTFHQAERTLLGSVDTKPLGLGGWTLSPHHVYDSASQTLHQGDGKRRRPESIPAVIRSVQFPTGNVSAPFLNFSTNAFALAPDGSLFIHERAGGNPVKPIRRVSRDGVVTDIGPPLNGFSAGMALGPDGSVFVAIAGCESAQDIDSCMRHRVVRIAPDGTTTTVAGTGQPGFSGDGGPATQAQLNVPSDIAVGPDGSLFIADKLNHRIRYVDPNGIITTFAGAAPPSIASCPFDQNFAGDGGAATAASLLCPTGVALAQDGSVVISDTGNNRVRRVAIDGKITSIAGTGAFCGIDPFTVIAQVPLPCGDGGPATGAALTPRALAVARDGTVYVADSREPTSSPFSRVRRIGNDGTIVAVAGNGGTSSQDFEGRPATQVAIDPTDLAVAPDGVTLYLANALLDRVDPALPGLSLTDVAVASPDGRLLYAIDQEGRHLKTLHALTGATLFEFNYDAAGRLASVVEKTGGTDNVTTIQHDASGNPTKIVGPYGQQTLLAVDANGHLSTVTNPAAETFQATYSPGGLLQTFTDPRSKTRTYAYDAAGHLTVATDPAGGSQTFARTQTSKVLTVSRTTGLGRTTTFKVDRTIFGERRQTFTAPGGEKTESLQKSDGKSVVTKPDGTTITTVVGPDPRWGMQAPVATSTTVRVPSGLERTVERTLVATLSNPAQPLSLTSLTETTIDAGRTSSVVYTDATRTLVANSAQGRTSSTILDQLGRPVALQRGDLDVVSLGYDLRGRLAIMSRGSGGSARSASFAYGSNGFLASTTDPLGRTTSYTRDAAGRATSTTLPDGRVVGYGYDLAGNVTSVTPPGRAAHVLARSDRDELTSVTPPAVPGGGPEVYGYDADRSVSTVQFPDGRSMAATYDSAGRLAQRQLLAGVTPTASATLAYDAQGRLAAIAESGIAHAFAYDGELFTGETMSGGGVGSTGFSYDALMRVAQETVAGAPDVPRAYDNDDLPTGFGALAIARSTATGLPTASSLGVVATSIGYNGAGELISYTATAAATPVYSFTLQRDARGRVVQKTETVGGTTTVDVHSYDPLSQLTSVTRGGVAVESYTYDENGNRLVANVGGQQTATTLDGQDRIVQSGSSTFAYNAAGQLASVTAPGQTTTYQYDPAGNLLSVALAGGPTVSYVIDGRDRRIGRRVDGVLVQQFVYADARRIVAELDGTGTLVSRFVYAGGNMPASMVRGGVTFRLLTDHVGSVRLVVNATDGSIAQRLDYDAWGNVTADTNPGFQPFAFAGGLYDGTTKLLRFGARDYDPRLGRWTAKDPLGFGGRDANLYRYAGNDPANRVDPQGTIVVPETPLDELEEAWSNVKTKITQALNPETNEPLETKPDFVKRRNRILDRRLNPSKNRELARDLAKDVANCAGKIVDAAGKGLKGLATVTEVLGFIDLAKAQYEASEEGRDLTFEEAFEAYFGYPAGPTTGSAPAVL